MASVETYEAAVERVDRLPFWSLPLFYLAAVPIFCKIYLGNVMAKDREFEFDLRIALIVLLCLIIDRRYSGLQIAYTYGLFIIPLMPLIIAYELLRY